MSDEISWCYPLWSDEHWSDADSREAAIAGALERIWDDAEDLKPGAWHVTVEIGHMQQPKVSDFFRAENMLDRIEEDAYDEAPDLGYEVSILGLRPWRSWHKAKDDAEKEKRIEDGRRVSELELQIKAILDAWCERYGYKVPWWLVSKTFSIALEVELDEELWITSWREVGR